LSILRPWRENEAQLPNQTIPIFGLYAMRGWDFGTSWRDNVVYDSSPETNNTPKRFLTIAQGLQLPYHPNGASHREPGDSTYTADRERVFGFHMYSNNNPDVAFVVYDTWIGEGFSPREVRAILGLASDDLRPNNSTKIRGTYVYSSAADDLGESDLEKQGFYTPVPKASGNQ
jgi:hypothetical protein